MSKIPSIVIAIITAGATAYASIYPLLQNPAQNAFAIFLLLWAFVTTASHAASDFLPSWYLNLVTDIDGFVTNIKASKAGQKTADAAKSVALKTIMVIAMVLASSLFVVGCSTACSALLAYAKGEPVAKPALELICDCLPVDKQICIDGGKGLDLSAQAAQNVYNAYCSSEDAGSDTSTDAGVKLARLSKLSTKDDVRAYLIAQGAKVVGE